MNQRRAARSSSWHWSRAAALLLAAACQGAPETPAAPPGPRDWTLGSWQGLRRDGADGSSAPMTLRVEPILGGAGRIEQLEVVHADGTYRGFSAELFDPELGRWVKLYANAVRGRFVRLEGEVEEGRSVWRSVDPQRTRESRLVSERLADGRWRRTQSVSEDGGATWRVLWMDELERGTSIPR